MDGAFACPRPGLQLPVALARPGYPEIVVHSPPMMRTRHLFFKLFLAAAVLGGLFLIYLDARITATFTDKMWELPARVYARPLELFEGAGLRGPRRGRPARRRGLEHGSKTSPSVSGRTRG